MSVTKKVKIRNTSSKKKYTPQLISVVLIVLSLIVVANAVSENQKKIEREEEEQRQIELQFIEEEKARALKEQQDIQEYYKNLPELIIDTVYNLPSLKNTSKILDVPIIYQYPELPAGCECVALTNQLNYYGYSLNKTNLIDNYLTNSHEDFIYSFYGDPYDYNIGGVIMAPGIKLIANEFLEDNNSNYRAYNVSGKDFEDLYAYIERGHPVQIWASIDMEELGESFLSIGNYNFFLNSHSVLLEGFDRNSDTVYIADSISGHCKYKLNTVKKIYEEQNYQAIVLISQEEINSWIPKAPNIKENENQSNDQDQSDENQN